MLPTTVIIPCFNAASTLARALASCIAQPEAAQIIVVDDGSTDASMQVAAQFAARDSRIQLLALNQNAGAARARNWGAMHADFGTLAFLDADDEYLPGALAVATQHLKDRPQDGSIRLNIEFAGFPEKICRHPHFEQLGAMVVGTVPSSLVIRRSLFMTLGGFPCADVFRKVGGEDMPLSKSLAWLQGNPRLTSGPHVRMHYHAGIHAERFFAINMGFATDPNPAQTQSVIDIQMRIAQRGVAAFEEVRSLRDARIA
jgi:glycosyltransferase involved in cell wall biosynthesis